MRLVLGRVAFVEPPTASEAAEKTEESGLLLLLGLSPPRCVALDRVERLVYLGPLADLSTGILWVWPANH